MWKIKWQQLFRVCGLGFGSKFRIWGSESTVEMEMNPNEKQVDNEMAARGILGISFNSL